MDGLVEGLVDALVDVLVDGLDLKKENRTVGAVGGLAAHVSAPASCSWHYSVSQKKPTVGGVFRVEPCGAPPRFEGASQPPNGLLLAPFAFPLPPSLITLLLSPTILHVKEPHHHHTAITTRLRSGATVMADAEPSILDWVRGLVRGTPVPKYRHTFLIWQPSDPTEPTFICRIAGNGALDGRTVWSDWTRLVRPLGAPRLIVSAADMDMYEFEDLVAKAGDDVVKNRASGVAMDLAIQRLSAWSPPQREAEHTAQAAKIYAAEVENEYEDSLLDPDDIGKSCSVL